MRTVDYKTYSQEKKSFMEKHEYNYKIETSPMDCNGVYTKIYMFEDGAEWTEVMRPVFEKALVEVKQVKFEMLVKLLETEFFNTESSKSSYYYERF